ncbi:hypothetical protein Tco_0415761 [Tanacetum coccineum]
MAKRRRGRKRKRVDDDDDPAVDMSEEENRFHYVIPDEENTPITNQKHFPGLVASPQGDDRVKASPRHGDERQRCQEVYSGNLYPAALNMPKILFDLASHNTLNLAADNVSIVISTPNSDNFDEHYCVVKNTHGETWGDGGKSRVAFEVFEYVMFPVYKGQEERDKEEREKKERQEKKREKKEKEKEEGNKVEEISEGSDAGGGGSVKMRKMVEDKPDGGDDGGVAGGENMQSVVDELRRERDDGDDDGDTSIKKNEQEKEKSGGEGGDKEEPGVGVVAYVQSSE